MAHTYIHQSIYHNINRDVWLSAFSSFYSTNYETATEAEAEATLAIVQLIPFVRAKDRVHCVLYTVYNHRIVSSPSHSTVSIPFLCVSERQTLLVSLIYSTSSDCCCCCCLSTTKVDSALIRFACVLFISKQFLCIHNFQLNSIIFIIFINWWCVASVAETLVYREYCVEAVANRIFTILCDELFFLLLLVSRI